VLVSIERLEDFITRIMSDRRRRMPPAWEHVQGEIQIRMVQGLQRAQPLKLCSWTGRQRRWAAASVKAGPCIHVDGYAPPVCIPAARGAKNVPVGGLVQAHGKACGIMPWALRGSWRLAAGSRHEVLPGPSALATASAGAISNLEKKRLKRLSAQINTRDLDHHERYVPLAAQHSLAHRSTRRRYEFEADTFPIGLYSLFLFPRLTCTERE